MDTRTDGFLVDGPATVAGQAAGASSSYATLDGLRAILAEDDRGYHQLCLVRGHLYTAVRGPAGVYPRDLLAGICAHASVSGDYVDAGVQLTDGYSGHFYLEMDGRRDSVGQHIAAIGTIMAALKELQDALVSIQRDAQLEKGDD